MPRPVRVTRERLLEAALELVDEEGLEALTMRRLGHRAGVDPAMVYRLFDSKEDLLEALADAVFAGASRPPQREHLAHPARPQKAGDWQTSLHDVGHGIRSALLAHPALIGLAVRRPPRGEVTYRGIDAGLGLLLSAGFSEADAAWGYQAVLFYALGFAALEAPFAAAPDGGVAQQASTREALAALPPDRYPHVAATLPHLYGADLTAQFDYGLRTMIAGLASRTDPTNESPAR